MRCIIFYLVLLAFPTFTIVYMKFNVSTKFGAKQACKRAFEEWEYTAYFFRLAFCGSTQSCLLVLEQDGHYT